MVHTWHKKLRYEHLTDVWKRLQYFPQLIVIYNQILLLQHNKCDDTKMCKNPNIDTSIVIKYLSYNTWVNLVKKIFHSIPEISRNGSDNALRPRQNVCHFAGDIFKCILRMKNLRFSSKFHWNIFSRVHLTICHYWFKQWYWYRI